MEELDYHLFIEILLSEDVSRLGSEIIDGSTVEYFHGRNGKRVAIWGSDEFLSAKICSIYLTQLGCEDLIERLFPNQLK